MTCFSLNPDLDRAKIAAEYAQCGRVHVRSLLREDQARALAAHLDARRDWRLLINGGDKVFDIERAAFDAMDPAERLRIDSVIHNAAAEGFQFRFESIRVPDDAVQRRDNDTMLDRFASFLGEPAQRAFLGGIINQPVDMLDAQATRYAAGDFLTGHDDNVAGKHRLAAYVFGMVDGWRPEWGGLLAFHGADGHIDRAFSPMFNSLNIFAVPQLHSVSMVTPFALRPRLSVTGWARGFG